MKHHRNREPLTEVEKRRIRDSRQSQDKGQALGQTWGNSVLPNTSTTHNTTQKGNTHA